jgi:hypothetical protein
MPAPETGRSIEAAATVAPNKIEFNGAGGLPTYITQHAHRRSITTLIARSIPRAINSAQAIGGAVWSLWIGKTLGCKLKKEIVAVT